MIGTIVLLIVLYAVLAFVSRIVLVKCIKNESALAAALWPLSVCVGVISLMTYFPIKWADKLLDKWK